MYEPKTFKQTIMPLILANAIHGMGNFQYHGNRERRIFSLLYSVLWILSLSLLCKVSISYFELFFTTKSSILSNLTYKALLYGNISLTICLIIAGWLKAKGMRVIIARVTACDQTMEKMGMSKNYRLLFVYQLRVFGIISVLTAVFMILNYNWLFLEETPLKIRILLTVVLNFPIIPICIADSSFCFWVRYTRLKFQQLNDLLRGMLTTTPESPQHKRVLAMKYDLINKDITSLGGDQMHLGNDNADKMKAVKQIHLELVKTAKNTNEMYGIQILLAMTTSFVLITGLLYNAYTLIWLEVSLYELLQEMTPVCFWIIFYALKIFLVNHTCSQTSSEAQNTGDIICELYEPSTSREFRAEIRDFTLQLIQNPLIFTACGFFDLDHTFVQGVIGSITTYLVILIQVGEIPHANLGEAATNTTNATTDVID